MLQILRDAGGLQGSLKYNYDTIDAGVREQVIEAALDIRQRINRAQGDLLATGQKLIETKDLLPHGQFQDWVQTEFGFSQRTAQNFMNVAERFAEKSETVSLFSDSALYLLAAPSTPAAAIDAAAEEAAATGASPTKERVKEIIAEHKPVRRLDATENEAVIWRAIQHSGAASPAEQLYWLDRSHIEDFERLLNPGVGFDLQTHVDAYDRVREVLRMQNAGKAQPKAAEQPEERSITEDLDSAIRRAVVIGKSDEIAYRRMASFGASDLTIMAQMDVASRAGGEASGAGLYYVEIFRTKGGPAVRVGKKKGDPNPALLAFGQSLIDHVRRAWGIPYPQTAQNAPVSTPTAPASTNTPATPPRHDLAASVPLAGPAVEIVDDDEADEASDADQRLFDAKLILANINRLLDRDLKRYEELTGKFMDTPAARRNLMPLRAELLQFIEALGG